MVGSAKTLLVTLCLVVAVTAAVLPNKNSRHSRDVSEIAAEPPNNYLPPAVESTEANAAELRDKDSEVVESATPASAAPEESAPLGANGYEYRTIRKLRLRQRRDVSHLNLGYLPPVNKPKAAKVYLPPNVDAPKPLPKFTNEYLPPTLHDAIKSEPITEAPVEENDEPEATEAPATEAAPEEEHQDTAILADDGYHYKKPAVVPNLFPTPADAPEQEAKSQNIEEEPEPESEQAPTDVVEPLVRDYLPPLEDEPAMELDAPEEESAQLNDDGYHYRVVKRFRFF